MAEVRCPMCGKANPADAEMCQFCSARIKPLNLSGSGGDDAGVPDWLRDLRGKDSADGPADPFTGGSGGQADEGEVPDWLARIRERSRQGDEPDSGEQDSDWLGSLRAGGDTLPESSETPAADETAAQSFGADFGGAFTPDAGESDAQEALPSSGEDLPDWLSQLGSESHALESSPPAQNDDWLSNLQAVSFESPSEETPLQPAGSQDLPDWLSQIGGAPAADTPAESGDFHFDFEETPAASDTPATPGEEDAPEQQAAGGSQMPDWLAGFNQPDAATGQSDAASMPDWLSAAGGDEIPQAGGEAQDFAAPTQAGDLPSWLQGEQTPAQDERQPTGQFSQDIPAWLQSEQPQPQDDTQPEAEFHADLPAWMSAATPSGDDQTQPEQADFESTPAGETPQTAWGESIPDWLSGIQPEESQPQTQPFEESAAELSALQAGEGEEEEAIPTAREDVPAWLSRLNEQPGLGGDQSEAPIFTRQPIDDQVPQAGETMPDWLARMSPPEETHPPAGDQEETHPGRDEEITLAPGDLPNWVQAMRPIESAALQTPLSQEVDERIEKAGPLAGLKGIIPSEPVVGGLRKPPVYSVKLHTSEKQRADIELLESVVAAESQPRALPSRGAVTSQSLLRWVIALALLLAVAVPLWMQSNLLAVPGAVAPELVALNRDISVLPEGATVLLAVEYEPALSGELEAAASSLVTHLMTRSANIVLFSTNPTGPVLGERLLARARNIQPGLPAGGSANLGYLPGGPAALLNFALNPRGSTSTARSVQDAWSQPYLQNIRTAADFSAVILLTENADTARAWIEQVSPTLQPGEKPMYVVSSAQSAPMISPYVDSGQFQGMLVGLAGGASYEQLRQYPATASAYWDAYQVGVLVLIVLILIGGLYALGQELIRQNRQDSGDAS